MPAQPEHGICCSTLAAGATGLPPHISGFMNFWVERGVDILDLGDVDREVE